MDLVLKKTWSFGVACHETCAWRDSNNGFSNEWPKKKRFPSTFAMCQSFTGWEPLETHVETTFRQLVQMIYSREPSTVGATASVKASHLPSLSLSLALIQLSIATLESGRHPVPVKEEWSGEHAPEKEDEMAGTWKTSGLGHQRLQLLQSPSSV